MTPPAVERVPNTPALSPREVLGQQISAALAVLRRARQKANAEPSGYHANQELIAQVEMDRLVEMWPTRQPV